MFHKVPRFLFDGIANHSDVIYVCFELEMSLGQDIGGGPTLLGAAKPFLSITFIYYIPFLSVQQIGSRITLLWGCSMLLFWLPSILLLQRWNKIDIKTLHIAFASSSAALSTCAEELQHTWYHYKLTHFSFPHEKYLYFNWCPWLISIYSFFLWSKEVTNRSLFSFLHPFTNLVFHKQVLGHANTWPWGNGMIRIKSWTTNIWFKSLYYMHL